MVLVLLYLDRDGQLADTACLRVPRIYQVTPDIPDRRRATQQNGSQALARPTASKRVSSPPVGTIPSASDVTDSPIQTASLQAGSPASFNDPTRRSRVQQALCGGGDDCGAGAGGPERGGGRGQRRRRRVRRHSRWRR